MISLTKRKEPAAPAVDEAATVQAARTRARRRLIGAAVLVGVGIVGFPLLFETQPRPIAVDIPIEIPSKDTVPPLALPASKPAAAAAPRPATASPAERVAAAPAESAAPASAAPVPSAPAVPVPSAPQMEAAPAPPAAAPAATQAPPTPTVAAAPATRPDPAATDRAREAQRAQDLLEGRAAAAVTPASSATDARAPRFVVQAGAYTDPAALRDARQKVERLGLKTYTQVVEVDGNSRTRVRVGPFATRDEAEKAAARIKSAGLAANILVL